MQRYTVNEGHVNIVKNSTLRRLSRGRGCRQRNRRLAHSRPGWLPPVVMCCRLVVRRYLTGDDASGGESGWMSGEIGAAGARRVGRR